MCENIINDLVIKVDLLMKGVGLLMDRSDASHKLLFKIRNSSDGFCHFCDKYTAVGIVIEESCLGVCEEHVHAIYSLKNSWESKKEEYNQGK